MRSAEKVYEKTDAEKSYRKQSEAVKSDMKESRKWIERAEPILSGLLSGWHLIPVEGKEDEVSRILDITCGIDYLLCSEDSSNVYGIASRVQYGKNYRTFTVRKERVSGAKTEYSKRSDALNSGGLTPYYTMQVYIQDGNVNGLGLVKTKDLMNFIERGLALENKTGEDKTGQAKFYVCNWDDMRAAGYTVKEYGCASGWNGKVCYNGSPEFLNSCKDTSDVDIGQSEERKKFHEAWHEAYQQYIADMFGREIEDNEEDCVECNMREVCDICEAMSRLS